MNRKERRAKDAYPASSTSSIKSADDIPLARPDTGTSRSDNDNTKKTKTLVEIVAERQAQLNAKSGSARGGIDANAFKPENIVQLKIGEDGHIISATDPRSPASSSSRQQAPSSPGLGSEYETPWFDTILLTMSLSAVHFTLSVLTAHQYAQELRFRPLVMQTIFVAFPTMLTLIALFHGQLLPSSLTSDRVVPASVRGWIITLRQAVYVVTANAAGCYLVALTNDRGYYAVMKNAPGIGTIWVWAVLELGLLGAVAGAVGPVVYAWWKGYGIL